MNQLCKFVSGEGVSSRILRQKLLIHTPFSLTNIRLSQRIPYGLSLQRSLIRQAGKHLTHVLFVPVRGATPLGQVVHDLLKRHPGLNQLAPLDHAPDPTVLHLLRLHHPPVDSILQHIPKFLSGVTHLIRLTRRHLLRRFLHHFRSVLHHLLDFLQQLFLPQDRRLFLLHFLRQLHPPLRMREALPAQGQLIQPGLEGNVRGDDGRAVYLLRSLQRPEQIPKRGQGALEEFPKLALRHVPSDVGRAGELLRHKLVEAEVLIHRLPVTLTHPAQSLTGKQLGRGEPVPRKASFLCPGLRPVVQALVTIQRFGHTPTQLADACPLLHELHCGELAIPHSLL